MEFKQALLNAAAAYGVEFNEEQIALFERYYDLLIEWNAKMNLTAITEPGDVAVKHMIDSVSCYDPKYFPQEAGVIDVGTGAGFPAVPLKIYQPHLKMTLLDSLNKRLNFLQAVTEQLEFKNISLVHSRAEDGGKQKNLREKFQVAVSRAVARLNVLCELCLPYVVVGGYFVALKGSQSQEEIDQAERAVEVLGGRLAEVRQVRLPGLEDKRAVIYIEKIKATPAVYPRRPGLPEKKPL